jgi:hypothetical protein
MEYEQRVSIRFLCKEGASAKDSHARLEAQFGDAPYSERSIQLWCQYVWQGREDLCDEVRSGRRPIDFLDIRILPLLDEQPFIRFIRLLKPSLFPTQPSWSENCHLRWLPLELTASFRQIRMETCRELLSILTAHEKINFKDL